MLCMMSILRKRNFKSLARGLIVTEVQRRYGDRALATHLVGHIGQGDGEGKVGLELAFNNELKCDSPRMLAAVIDGKNNLVEGLGFRLWENRNPHRPYDIILTIDSKLQAKVESIMDKTIAGCCGRNGSTQWRYPGNGKQAELSSVAIIRYLSDEMNINY